MPDIQTFQPINLGGAVSLRAAAAMAAPGPDVSAIGRTIVPLDPGLTLSEAEALAIAQKYGDPRLGEGFDKLDEALGEEWPDPKGVLWLGGSGKALPVDSAFRAAPGEKLADFADLISKAVAAQDSAAIDSLLEKMR
jgi:hypothetical protein